MASYEIEIKSLLGSAENADRLRDRLKKHEPSTELLSKHKQLNHYFIDGDIEKLENSLSKLLSKKEQKELHGITKDSTDFSIRTRLIDEEKLIFVIKASKDEGSSHNTVTRLEFEAEVNNMTLDELDQLILDAGFTYQSKWSREREEYVCQDMNVCLDRNAGYGYLAEFEKVVEDELSAENVRNELRSFMDELGVEELPQDRLERMFAHYNENWPDYYGTDKIFIV